MTDLKEEETKTIACKVVLLGECGVGKSCIISRFLHDTFQGGHFSTKGANYVSKSIEFKEHNTILKLEIYDTAGQERFRSLNKIIYKDAFIIILVYDITRKESFDELKKYWYKAVCNNAPKKITLAVVGNKNDLYEKEQIDEEITRKYAKEIGAIFRLTSASNAFGIDELFQVVGKKYLDPKKKDDDLIRNPSIKIDNENHQERGKQKEKEKEKEKEKGCC